MKKPLINNQIRAEKVRVIDETGKQLGVVDVREALQQARERHLDLIQVTEKVEPPVCRFGQFGKYLYWQEKKQKEAKRQKGGGIKGIRLSFGISAYDIGIRAKQAEKFLKAGNKIFLEVVLRGREKALANVAREKVNLFLDALNKLIPVKVEGGSKRGPRGFTMVITKE